MKIPINALIVSFMVAVIWVVPLEAQSPEEMAERLDQAADVVAHSARLGNRCSIDPGYSGTARLAHGP